MINRKHIKCIFAGTLVIFALTACERQALQIPRAKRTGEIGRKYESDKKDTLFGSGGLDLTGSKSKAGAGGGGALGVNSYLWRATLDTVTFLPVTSADAFGGVILTDWYSPPETPKERFKVNVFILGRTLRADGLRVSIFRQIQSVAGWRDAVVEKDSARKFEDAILTRARLLRNETRKLQ